MNKVETWLQEKHGPLPGWAYVGIAGVVVVWILMHRKSSTSTSTATTQTPLSFTPADFTGQQQQGGGTGGGGGGGGSGGGGGGGNGGGGGGNPSDLAQAIATLNEGYDHIKTAMGAGVMSPLGAYQAGNLQLQQVTALYPDTAGQLPANPFPQPNSGSQGTQQMTVSAITNPPNIPTPVATGA